MILETIKVIAFIILFIIIIFILYKIFSWANIKVYHLRFPEQKRLKRKLLYGELTNRYGKNQGKKIFNQITDILYRDHKIK